MISVQEKFIFYVGVKTIQVSRNDHNFEIQPHTFFFTLTDKSPVSQVLYLEFSYNHDHKNRYSKCSVKFSIICTVAHAHLADILFFVMFNLIQTGTITFPDGLKFTILTHLCANDLAGKTFPGGFSCCLLVNWHVAAFEATFAAFNQCLCQRCIGKLRNSGHSRQQNCRESCSNGINQPQFSASATG